MRNISFLTLALLCGLMAPLAHAEQADRNKPIQVDADRMTLDQVKGTTDGDGNVVITQGTLVLRADHVTVKRDPQGNEIMVATGRIVTFRQKTDDPGPTPVWIVGQANRIDYDTIKHTAILTTNARVKKGEDLVIGDVIVYDTQTQIYHSQGGGANTVNKGRVTVILQPQKQKASDGSGKQP